MRLIDADALKEYIDCGHLRSPAEVCFSELDVVNMLDKCPTIDAVPVRHGSWTEEHDETQPILFQRVFRCSACGRTNTYGKSAFCPFCGAEMRG